MVKLTSDLIEQAIQYVNPVRERELLLRGYKIPVIENLGATLDQFDTIDFSDNDIRKFDGFPVLNRLRSLMFNNNRICRIEEDIHTSIPNLEQLYLTNNELSQLSEIDRLVGFKKLEFLSLLRNPVTHQSHYRLYTIHKLPHLRILDFRRIKQKERLEAKKLFGTKEGKSFANEISKKAKVFVPGESASGTSEPVLSGPSKADRDAIKEAILKAKSLEEIEKLRALLQSGHIPGKEPPLTNGNSQTRTE